MGKYGEAAIVATQLIISNRENNPIDAWKIAMAKIYPESESSRKKGCPRNTFLGICEEGFINGIQAGNYTRSRKNKNYAIKALSILSTSNNSTLDAQKLWELVIEGQPKRHNSQMDIVLTLWSNRLINTDLL
jgi:hypothetical protein